MSRSTAPTPADPPTDVWVQMRATVGPTAHDRARYEAGSIWCMNAARAEALIADGSAARVDAPQTAPAVAAVAAAAPDEE